MSWSECLYQYHKKYGGQLLAGGDEDALLVLTWKDRPLAVDLSHYVSSGRGGVSSAYFVRARVPVTLGKPYKLTVGAEKKLSGGVNAVLKMVPEVAGFSADFGYPEVTQKRLIRTENVPGPGGEGLHLIAVTTDASLAQSDWYTAEYPALTEEEKAETARRVEEEFFPRMDRFLDLARAAYNAVTQWPM